MIHFIRDYQSNSKSSVNLGGGMNYGVVNYLLPPKKSHSQPSTSPPPELIEARKAISKQWSMRETKRELNWEKRRRQIRRQERKRNEMIRSSENCLTDEDFNELKASIELGFGFNEESGQQLCNTLPALDMYLAVNRQVSGSPVSSPLSPTSSSGSSNAENPFSCTSPKSGEDSWKICAPGESPEQVKAKLRQWAQAVACSVMHCT